MKRRLFRRCANAPGTLAKGWLRCETSLILGTWQPAYRILPHAAAGLDLPTDVGLPPAHYAVRITRPGRPLLRIGPYTQCRHADHDADRLNQQLQNTSEAGGAATAVPFDFSATDTYQDPQDQDVDHLLARELATASSGPKENNR
ncbi:hypothetical protein [Streptomyces syringium]|uniref:hypothetical protein n=1 Tax=Streptomyces syringium TaxID=76729 RepID=UPI0033B11032